MAENTNNLELVNSTEVGEQGGKGENVSGLIDSADTGEGGVMPEMPEGAGVDLPPESEKIPPPLETQVEEKPAQSPADTDVVKPIEQQTPAIQIEDKKSLMARLYQKFRDKMFARKHTRLNKIIDLVNKKKKIKVGDVRKLLIVSDSTALRYLNQLVKEGRLKRSGKSVEASYEIL